MYRGTSERANPSPRSLAERLLADIRVEELGGILMHVALLDCITVRAHVRPTTIIAVLDEPRPEVPLK